MYKLYTGDGSETTYEKLITELSQTDVVFFGELHDDPIAHWLQLEATRDLYSTKKENLILGAEMFEADNQLIMDEYLNKLITESKFNAEMRLWPNYKTDYSPLVSFAYKNHLRFIATNIPRRYASRVFTGGLESLAELTEEAKSYIAPLPIEYDSSLACYKNMLEMEEMGDHAMPTLPMAQAAKDATMAYFINKNWKKGNLFIHYNGTYHSENQQGILIYLKKYAPQAHTVTIATVRQENIALLSEEHKGKADFIIVVSESITRTH